MQVGSRVRLKRFPDETGRVGKIVMEERIAIVCWETTNGMKIGYPLDYLEEIEPPDPAGPAALHDMVVRAANMKLALAHAERAKNLLKDEYPEAKAKDTVKVIRDTLANLTGQLRREQQDG